MIRVDLGNKEWNQWVHPVTTGIADDEMSRLGEGRFDVLGGVGIERREHQVRPAPGGTRLDAHPAEIVRHRRRQAPGCGVGEGLALGTLAGAKPSRPEPRMIRKLFVELLTDHPGRADNANVDACVVHTDQTQKKTAGLVTGRRVLELFAVFAQLRGDRAHPRPADSLRPLSTNRLGHGGHRHDCPAV